VPDRNATAAGYCGRKIVLLGNYFWYERTFTAPARRDSAVLVVNKAQFGTAIWLNGKNIGEHLGCFTAGRFDATAAVNWSGENRLLIRIGAHPGALPVWACGTRPGSLPSALGQRLQFAARAG
jgi:hypothetical protein